MKKAEHLIKYDAAVEAVDELFSVTSVSPAKTLDMLEELRDEIEMKIECLKADLSRQD